MNKKDLFANLDKMFFPKSVAIVGSTDIPGKWGFLITSNILGNAYKGKVYPVNSTKKNIMGCPVYPDLKDVPDGVDLAFVTIPAKALPETLKTCIAKNIRAVVIISSGFSETGQEGKLLEKEIVDIATQGGITFIGPNTMGIASMHNDLVSVGTPVHPLKGGLGIISQSGNLGTQIIQWSISKNIGLGIYAGTGNEAQLKTNDLLSYFGSRHEVSAIALYIEGISDGKGFMESVKHITKVKPVIALKGGRTSTGSQAVKSHTGSMAGSAEIYNSMFKQTGVIQVDNPSELLYVAGAMSVLPVPKGNRIGIMSLGGGWGVITVDECEMADLKVPSLSEHIIEDLNKWLPSFWNKANPIDLVGEPNPELHIHTLNLLANWDEVDSVIALGTVGQVAFYRTGLENQERIMGKKFSPEIVESVLKARSDVELNFFKEMARLQKETKKPILAVSLAQEDTDFMVNTEHGNVITLPTPEEAVNIIKHMVRYRNYIDSL
jgi:acyl-CoA synthetase (NDP forming)